MTLTNYICNLCGFCVNKNDVLLELRMNSHTDWHKDPGYKRNTIRGEVKWLQV